LITYGTERFLGGGLDDTTIKIFDFRWTKSYYHTTGQPCSSHAPFPKVTPPLLYGEPSPTFTRRPKCDHVSGHYCTWHALSRQDYYRPNVNIYLGRSLANRGRSAGRGIWSLAKESDLSPRFYIGIPGGVIEANLEPSSGCDDPFYPPNPVDPNFGIVNWRQQDRGGYQAIDIVPAMVETGSGWGLSPDVTQTRVPPLFLANREGRTDNSWRLDGRWGVQSVTGMGF
jgi:hypothetical protein